MTQSSSVIEPSLRMALSNLTNAVGYIERIWDDEDVKLGWALGGIDNAISILKDYASLNNIELREGMKT